MDVIWTKCFFFCDFLPSSMFTRYNYIRVLWPTSVSILFKSEHIECHRFWKPHRHWFRHMFGVIFLLEINHQPRLRFFAECLYFFIQSSDIVCRFHDSFDSKYLSLPHFWVKAPIISSLTGYCITIFIIFNTNWNFPITLFIYLSNSFAS